MKRIHEMTFNEFAEAAKPSAGMNRWPQIGPAQEVVSYSVYMNGDIAQSLPQSALEHEFRDVMLHSLTAKVGLDPLAMRDNLKVAELVAVRHAYMTAVLEASIVFELSSAVTAEYETLSDQMNHPYIVAAIEQQKHMSKLIAPVLADAARALGVPVQEQQAAGVVRGEVISKDGMFTVQSTGDGKIVVHENDRLQGDAGIGAEVTVVYYRGTGQVLDNVNEQTISQPYIDADSGDIAVRLFDSEGKAKQVIKFGSIALVAQFANEHSLSKSFVEQAMDVRSASPKTEAGRDQTIDGLPFMDPDTNAIAFNFREGLVKYAAVFSNVEELVQHAKRLGASESFLQHAHQVQLLNGPAQAEDHERTSLNAAYQAASHHAGPDGTVKPANVTSGRYAGRVVATTALHVVQDAGRNEIVIHDKRNLDRVPVTNERLSLNYMNGRAESKMREVSPTRNSGR